MMGSCIGNLMANHMTRVREGIDLSGRAAGERVFLSADHCDDFSSHNPTTELPFTVRRRICLNNNNDNNNNDEPCTFRCCDYCLSFAGLNVDLAKISNAPGAVK